MLITTTPTVDGKRITKYLGIVTGEAILGANVFKDIFAGIRGTSAGGPPPTRPNLHRARPRPTLVILRSSNANGTF